MCWFLDPNQQQGYYGQSQPGYPPQQPGFNPGYPGQPGYPAQSGYPQPGFPQPPYNNSGYDPQQPSYPQQQPAYIDPEDPDGSKNFDFTDESIRKGFIRKVYSILTVSLFCSSISQPFFFIIMNLD